MFGKEISRCKWIYLKGYVSKTCKDIMVGQTKGFKRRWGKGRQFREIYRNENWWYVCEKGGKRDFGCNNSVNSIVLCFNVQHASKIIAMCYLRALSHTEMETVGSSWVYGSGAQKRGLGWGHHFQHWNHDCKNSLGHEYAVGKNNL